nr:MAG TPA: hypothetical protein [Bacteriophage sp.]
MIDWQKDACGSMWFLSAKLREARGYDVRPARYRLRMCAESSTTERTNKQEDAK